MAKSWHIDVTVNFPDWTEIEISFDVDEIEFSEISGAVLYSLAKELPKYFKGDTIPQWSSLVIVVIPLNDTITIN